MVSSMLHSMGVAAPQGIAAHRESAAVPMRNACEPHCEPHAAPYGLEHSCQAFGGFLRWKILGPAQGLAAVASVYVQLGSRGRTAGSSRPTASPSEATGATESDAASYLRSEPRAKGNVCERGTWRRILFGQGDDRRGKTKRGGWPNDCGGGGGGDPWERLSRALCGPVSVRGREGVWVGVPRGSVRLRAGGWAKCLASRWLLA
jgi:hypothetical protein